MALPGNTTTRGLLTSEGFSGAVLKFLKATRIGEVKEGVLNVARGFLRFQFRILVSGSFGGRIMGFLSIPASSSLVPLSFVSMR